MEDDIFVLALVLNTVFLAGGVLVLLMAMYQRGKTREMQHRERLAMIERGLAAGPERDPAAFDAYQSRPRHPPSTSIGVVIIALGLGLMVLIGAASQAPHIAIGLGGAIMVLGAAFIVIGELHRRSQTPPPSWGSGNYPVTPPRPPASSNQPGPFGP